MWFVVLTNNIEYRKTVSSFAFKPFKHSVLRKTSRQRPAERWLHVGVLPTPCALMRLLQYTQWGSARDSQDPPVDPSRRVAYKLMIADLCRRPDVSYATHMNTGAQSQADQCHAGIPFGNLVGWVRLGCSHRFSGTKSMLLNISFDHPSPSSLCTSIIARCQGAGPSPPSLSKLGQRTLAVHSPCPRLANAIASHHSHVDSEQPLLAAVVSSV